MSGAPDLETLRGEMRRRRTQLSERERARSSQQICELLLSDPAYLRARVVGLYWAIAGEVDLKPLLEDLWERGRKACLPVVEPRGSRMAFHAVGPDTELRTDRFGIPTPVAASRVQRCDLDLLLTPVVAFDQRGQRIGMGAGYFDRYLAPLRRRRRPARPRVIGCAYAFQEVPELPAQAWDVPLDAVVTEAGTRIFNPPEAP
jgi:5-formyltetrahydrofolate cyclo-ligase